MRKPSVGSDTPCSSRSRSRSRATGRCCAYCRQQTAAYSRRPNCTGSSTLAGKAARERAPQPPQRTGQWSLVMLIRLASTCSRVAPG